jgi:GNAT superfamily N-acetyltransferase
LALVRAARPEEFTLLGPIENEAGKRFLEVGLDLELSVPVADRGEMPLAVLVSGDPPVGFIWLTLVCGEPHIEEVAVVPGSGRQGVGRALVEGSCAWAAEARYRSVTLCTYRDVPWNGPFYRSAGFVELEPDGWCSELVELRDIERTNGLDDLGVRVVMIRPLN